MSVPIQKSAPDQLAGGQRLPLEGSDEQYNRAGYKGSQTFPLSGRSGVNVESSNGQQSPVAPNVANGAGSRPKESVSGMSVKGRAQENARRVDQVNVVDGQRHQVAGKQGDTAAASVREAAVGAGSPRAPRGQFPNGKRDAKLGSFSKDHADQSFPGNLNDSDAGN
jgi:hypothetical protein